MGLADRYRASIRLTASGSRVTPGGAQTASKRPDRFPAGAFPAYLGSGQGATVWDVDGHAYVDWICGLGAVPLGHKHPGVNDAIRAQLDTGLISASLPTELEEQVATRLLDIIPCGGRAGQVRFVKTGSEACAAAIRVARRATGRLRVIVVGYHGWHDWVQQTSPAHPGVPEDGLVIRVPYNDADIIADILAGGRIAAVMLEPTLLEKPIPTYLAEVVRLCQDWGALSIFDEMVTGFRWARAGGQEYFGVTPDLAVFGKGLANGMPLACIVGPRRVMQYADVISGTFGGEALSLAAAQAVLDAYAVPGPGPIQRQWQHGAWFLNICQALDIPTMGYAVHPRITYPEPTMSLFLQETARWGLLLHPGGFNVSAALTEGELDITRLALEKATRVLDSGNGVLEGAPPADSILTR